MVELPRLWSALDVDGVLFRWGRSVRRVLKARYGISVSEDVWFGESHVSPDQWSWIWSQEGVRQIYGEGETFPGALKFALALYDISRVHIITACPPDAERPRIDWLRRVGVPYDRITFVPPPTSTGVGTDGLSHASKSDVQPHCDIYIDDSIENCHELAAHTKARRIIMPNHSWNQGRIRNKRIIRVQTWGQALSIVKEYT